MCFGVMGGRPFGCVMSRVGGRICRKIIAILCRCRERPAAGRCTPAVDDDVHDCTRVLGVGDRVFGELGRPYFGSDGDGGADDATIVVMSMQLFERGSDGPPALMVQSHAPVSPPCDCNGWISRGINIPC